MCNQLKFETDSCERTRTQRREAAEIIGIDETYLLRLIHFFVARLRADKSLGRFYAIEDEEHRARQVAQMITFWISNTLETDEYVGDLVEVHRKLPDLRHEDFKRWLELFRATLDETAPTVAAANYLMIRAERVAAYLENAIFQGHTDAERD
ncbi:group III truncated hemoglobin [Roseovarius sp. M141]|uniref:group III truncated hemoglobin n=1 Tax=Roseovarius sp. M141 TaxID=2583806 RepID=UPI0020CB6F8C|nr:group III truncated hemoglobin [Roseovarius sp. M141]MCQ0093579.1 group III truncated hemoglobin [Roseovarius sp. M141]